MQKINALEHGNGRRELKTGLLGSQTLHFLNGIIICALFPWGRWESANL
jgi:hypothetical protein